MYIAYSSKDFLLVSMLVYIGKMHLFGAKERDRID